MIVLHERRKARDCKICLRWSSQSRRRGSRTDTWSLLWNIVMWEKKIRRRVYGGGWRRLYQVREETNKRYLPSPHLRGITWRVSRICSFTPFNLILRWTSQSRRRGNRTNTWSLLWNIVMWEKKIRRKVYGGGWRRHYQVREETNKRCLPSPIFVELREEFHESAVLLLLTLFHRRSTHLYTFYFITMNITNMMAVRACDIGVKLADSNIGSWTCVQHIALRVL